MDLIDIVGWGTDNTHRKNIETLSISGDKWIYGVYRSRIGNKLIPNGDSHEYYVDKEGIYGYLEIYNNKIISGIIIIHDRQEEIYGSTGNVKYAEYKIQYALSSNTHPFFVYPIIIFSDY